MQMWKENSRQRLFQARKALPINVRSYFSSGSDAAPHSSCALNISNHCRSRTSKISEADTVARELTNNNQTAIREIFDKWAAAVRAEDINGIRENHSPDMLMF